ncbi:hypothetical protein ACLBYG_12945 [Methylobacterium sp. D53M]|jgi:hypothetical protein
MHHRRHPDPSGLRAAARLRERPPADRAPAPVTVSAHPQTLTPVKVSDRIAPGDLRLDARGSALIYLNSAFVGDLSGHILGER